MSATATHTHRTAKITASAIKEAIWMIETAIEAGGDPKYGDYTADEMAALQTGVATLQALRDRLGA